ncbi:Ff.00g103420.m01.CDS01 [Fusarium sp. VM40]|nr:Ff.00g103420.m01.CDS01 [Fusarium sp. VM40]
MPSHITVLPASTKAGRETIRTLLESESKPSIRAVYRDPSKAPAEFVQNSNFEAVKGDVRDGSSLDFTGSDAVFYIPPPILDGTDQAKWATRSATNVKKALKDAGVRRLLILSAIGSQNSSGIGVLRLNHISDEILKDSVPEVAIIRPTYFFEDFTPLLDAAKEENPKLYSWITPIDYKIPLVGLKDVAENCANSLLSPAKPSPHYWNLFGPRTYGSADLKDAVEEITGKKVELVLVEEDQLLDYWKQIVPEAYAEDFKEMTTSGLPGGAIVKDFVYDENTIKGKQELVDGLRAVYKN